MRYRIKSRPQTVKGTYINTYNLSALVYVEICISHNVSRCLFTLVQDTLPVLSNQIMNRMLYTKYYMSRIQLLGLYSSSGHME